MRTEISELLSILQGTICASVKSDAYDISARQLAMMLIVGNKPNDFHTVRGLADVLSISRPAVSRSLDRLCNLDLAAREPDPRDGRSVLMVLTKAGRAYVRDLGRYMRRAAVQPQRRAQTRSMVMLRAAA